MPTDTDRTKPVLIHVNPDDWKLFKQLVGSRKASMKLRAFIRTYNAKTSKR